jgi:hypothetical protein
LIKQLVGKPGFVSGKRYGDYLFFNRESSNNQFLIPVTADGISDGKAVRFFQPASFCRILRRDGGGITKQKKTSHQGLPDGRFYFIPCKGLRYSFGFFCGIGSVYLFVQVDVQQISRNNNACS